jgi:predicted anti-sigma-YlaC factor YlaD
MRHYTTEELDRYRNGDMNMLSRISCAGHLKQCSSCRNLLETLKQDDQLLETVRKNLARFKAVSDEIPENKAAHHTT